MTLRLRADLLRSIEREGEAAYPEEGAGFMLGSFGSTRIVAAILSSANLATDGEKRNRYLISAEDYMRAEQAADESGWDVVGVFHSHPDHPEEPSTFDRDWAQPNLSYLITSVRDGKAAASKSWLLKDDRSRFVEENLEVTEQPNNPIQHKGV